MADRGKHVNSRDQHNNSVFAWGSTPRKMVGGVWRGLTRKSENPGVFWFANAKNLYVCGDVYGVSRVKKGAFVGGKMVGRR